MLNLIPAGTLDGGHVIYSLFGDSAKKLFPFIWVRFGCVGHLLEWLVAVGSASALAGTRPCRAARSDHTA